MSLTIDPAPDADLARASLKSPSPSKVRLKSSA
jgi:hypothetical protein